MVTRLLMASPGMKDLTVDFAGPLGFAGIGTALVMHLDHDNTAQNVVHVAFALSVRTNECYGVAWRGVAWRGDANQRNNACQSTNVDVRQCGFVGHRECQSSLEHYTRLQHGSGGRSPVGLERRVRRSRAEEQLWLRQPRDDVRVRRCLARDRRHVLGHQSRSRRNGAATPKGRSARPQRERPRDRTHVGLRVTTNPKQHKVHTPRTLVEYSHFSIWFPRSPKGWCRSVVLLYLSVYDLSRS